MRSGPSPRIWYSSLVSVATSHGEVQTCCHAEPAPERFSSETAFGELMCTVTLPRGGRRLRVGGLRVGRLRVRGLRVRGFRVGGLRRVGGRGRRLLARRRRHGCGRLLGTLGKCRRDRELNTRKKRETKTNATHISSSSPRRTRKSRAKRAEHPRFVPSVQKRKAPSLSAVVAMLGPRGEPARRFLRGCASPPPLGPAFSRHFRAPRGRGPRLRPRILRPSDGSSRAHFRSDPCASASR